MLAASLSRYHGYHAESWCLTHFDDLPLVEDDDEIGHSHRREPVRDEHGHRTGGLSEPSCDGSPPLEELVLGVCVERRGGLVQQQQQRVDPHHRSADRELLPLPSGEVDAAGPARSELGVEAGRERVQQVGRTGPFKGCNNRVVMVERRQVGDADGLADQELEPRVVREPRRDPASPLLGVERDPALRREVEARAEPARRRGTLRNYLKAGIWVPRGAPKCLL